MFRSIAVIQNGWNASNMLGLIHIPSDSTAFGRLLIPCQYVYFKLKAGIARSDSLEFLIKRQITSHYVVNRYLYFNVHMTR